MTIHFRNRDTITHVQTLAFDSEGNAFVNGILRISVSDITLIVVE